MKAPYLLLFYNNDLEQPDAFLQVQIATTSEELKQGLSGVTALDRNTGMVFVFDQPGVHRMQMKTARIPLDILFVDSTGHVVHVEENAQPGSEMIYGPEIITVFVVEANGGWASRNGVCVGTLVGIA